MSGLPVAKNLTTGLLLALLGVATLWVTSDFATGAAAAADPALLPRVIAVGLIGVGIGVAGLDVLSRRSGRAVQDDADGIPMELPVEVPEELLRDDETAGPTDWRQVLTLIAALAVYSVAAFRVGFVTSTVVFIVVSSIVLGRRRYPRAFVGLVVFAVSIAVIAYVAFFVLLEVRVPITPLP